MLNVPLKTNLITRYYKITLIIIQKRILTMINSSDTGQSIKRASQLKSSLYDSSNNGFVKKQ